MSEFISQFDVLGLGALLGSLLFLAALLWVLMDHRSFEDLNERHAERSGPEPRGTPRPPVGTHAGPEPGAVSGSHGGTEAPVRSLR